MARPPTAVVPRYKTIIAQRSSNMTTSTQSGKLLVVDCSTAMLHVLKNFTSRHGYDADHYADPADACERLDKRFQDFSCDYRSVILGWPEGRLDMVDDLLKKLSTADHDALPLIIVTQEMNADVMALSRRRPKTRAFLWSEYQTMADDIDMRARPRVTAEPASPSPGTVAAARPATDATAAASVLLVDTAPSVCESLHGKLTANGYQVSVSDSVAAAKQKINNERFDVVVTDFFLQGESGEALCQFLAESTAEQKPVCVVLTAKYSDSIVRQSLDVGAAACLYKNESTDLLFARINALTRTLRIQSGQSYRQSFNAPTPAQISAPSAASSSVKTPSVKPKLVQRDGAKAPVQSASLHTSTRTELQAGAAAASPGQGKVKLVTRKPGSTTDQQGNNAPVVVVKKQAVQQPVGAVSDSSSAKQKVDAKTVGAEIDTVKAAKGDTTTAEPVKPAQIEAKAPIEVSTTELLARLKGTSAAQQSLLMLDFEIMAATGDRMPLSDSEPMQKLVTQSLHKLYPKQKAQACTEKGQFLLLLTTIKFQDALVLTRKILQLVPNMVPYLNNMKLVAHAAVVRVDARQEAEPTALLEQCQTACLKARADRKDNAALVLPNNQYLSAVVTAETQKKQPSVGGDTEVKAAKVSTRQPVKKPLEKA